MDNTTQSFRASKQYFPTPIQEFQFLDKYSRFDYDKGRRETWIETVDRSVNFLRELSHSQLPDSEYDRIRRFILEMKATPSMRLLAMAGPAAQRTNIALYNCSYLPMDSIDSFVEQLIISMAGCGVGYSVERKYVDKLPTVKKHVPLNGHTPVWKIEDSTEGWAEALRAGLQAWFNGKDIKYDYSLIRLAGVPLKVKGGRASGPEPLQRLLDFARERILARQDRKLRPLDAHDIACKIGEAIVSGGVRRTALISLFDIDDQEMLHCKDGDLEKEGNMQRWVSNNSTVWNEEVTKEQLNKQMYSMVEAQNGEPGIFSRFNANKTKPERRAAAEFGTNPCGEISLRPYQFCNLSICVAREDDTIETLKEKVEVAAIIGTIQSMGTNFPGLRPIWKQNCEDERLLGVDINGQLDCPILRPSNPDLPKIFEQLRDHAVETNRLYAEKLGIKQSASVTCVKPSGNSSQLFNCSSGLHARHYRYYIRNIRVGTKSPMFSLLKDTGVPMDPDNGLTVENADRYVIHFPVKAPPSTITQDQMGAIAQCEYWLMNKLYWTEHNPSVTISYKPEEVKDLIKWVWEHHNIIGGMSFLPANNARYDQMPYEKLTEEEYTDRVKAFPAIDFSKLPEYEKVDMTTSSGELACTADKCEVDFTEIQHNSNNPMLELTRALFAQAETPQNLQ